MSQSNVLEPKLQKPGAGLPWFEHFVAKIMMPVLARKTTWDQSNQKFLYQSRKIEALIEGLSEEVMLTQVLVPKMAGIEDSSRFWSVAMTLEHLIQVGDAMADGIVLLSQGSVPPIEVNVAKVKPVKKFNATEAKQAFREMVERVNEKVTAKVKNRDSLIKLSHPWFGAMTAHQWNWLLATHQGIHKKQIEKILILSTAKKALDS